MLSFFAMWLTLAALCLLCAAVYALRAKAGAGVPVGLFAGLPLTVLCAAVLALCAAGCLGRLREGAVALLCLGGGAAAALAALAVRAHRARDSRLAAALRGCLVSPAWLLCFGGGALLALFLAWRQPLFTQWDEFSFWGSAAKVTHLYDTLYTLAPAANLAARTYPPALPVLGYMFSFLQPTFAPWLLYAAYDMLLLAAFGAIVGLAHRRAAAVFAAVCCLLLPFAAESWAPGQMLTAYVGAYADLPLAALCAGVLALWYGGRDAFGRPGGPWRPALAAAALVMTKDVGLPLALAAGALCVADCLAAPYAPKGPAGRWRRVRRAAALAAVLCAAALAGYFAWAAHLAAALGQDRLATGGAAGLSAAGMLVQGLRELLGIGRTARFAAVLRAMLAAYGGRRVTAFGSGAALTACIAAALAGAAWLARPARCGDDGRVLRRRIAAFGGVSALCFLGYSFFQLLCYVYVFGEADGLGLVAYPRYMSSWYLFWMLGALMQALRAAALPVSGAPRARDAGTRALAAGTWALLALCALRISMRDTLLGRSASAWGDEAAIEQRAAEVLAVSGPKDRALLISQWDDGGRWYRWAYALEPLALYHAPDSNTLLPLADAKGEGIVLPPEETGAFFEENGCTLLVLDVVDYDLWQAWRPLFTDHMAAWESGSCCVYRVQHTAQGVRFVPAKEAGA